jgi:hypothetical protein
MSVNWKAILKIIAVGAAGGAVGKGAEILATSGQEVAALIAPIAAVLAAYLMKQPIVIKPTPPAK